jgi:hypothetical protein
MPTNSVDQINADLLALFNQEAAAQGLSRLHSGAEAGLLRTEELTIRLLRESCSGDQKQASEISRAVTIHRVN